MNNRFNQLRTQNRALHNSASKVTTAVQNAANGQESTIYLYDVIDNDPYWGFTALQMAALLAEVTTPHIKLRINSPGGDVFEARAIATLLAQHPATVSVHIDGLAASAATYIALSGDSLEMADGAFFMIHNAWTYAAGNANDLIELAEELKKVDGSIAADYQRKTAAELEQIQSWMDEETWFTAAEALEHGFIDSVWQADVSDKNNSASWDLSAFSNSAGKTVFIELPKIENKETDNVEPEQIPVPDHVKRKAALLNRIC